MENRRWTLVEALVDINRILLERNPMAIDRPEPHEYMHEALSILSRFNEGVLHMCSDQGQRLDIAQGVVKQTFNFWFGETLSFDPAEMSQQLLASFIRTAEVQDEQGSDR
jgi:hypothetical protein